MPEDAASKAERYRKEANKYGELAKQAEPGYLADVFRKIAVRYVLMAEDVLREAERRALRTRLMGERIPAAPSDIESGPPDTAVSPSRTDQGIDLAGRTTRPPNPR
jgi:hypothetical protein